MRNKMSTLINAVKANDQELDTVQNCLFALNDCWQSVVRAEGMRPIWSCKKEDPLAEAKIAELDEAQVSAFQPAADACATLNQLCDKYGLEHFYPGSTEDHEQVATFVGQFVREMFVAGMSH